MYVSWQMRSPNCFQSSRLLGSAPIKSESWASKMCAILRCACAVRMAAGESARQKAGSLKIVSRNSCTRGKARNISSPGMGIVNPTAASPERAERSVWLIRYWTQGSMITASWWSRIARAEIEGSLPLRGKGWCNCMVHFILSAKAFVRCGKSEKDQSLAKEEQ